MNVLALDLGTKTGWALLQVIPDGEGQVRYDVTSGTWQLATEKELRQQRKSDLDRCCDMRFMRLSARVHEKMPLDWIYFEDVQFLSSQLQSQLWAGLRTAVSLLYPGVKIKAVPVGTLKKFATGKGNAKKEDMAAAYHKSGGCCLGKDDNEIDALHLLARARQELNLV